MRPHQHITRLMILAAFLCCCNGILLAQADSGVQVSDQKAGSILIFPFYGSDGAGNDTRITITNVGPAAGQVGFGRVGTAQTILNDLSVHLFFLDSTCAQADVFVCLTKYQSYSFRASEWDPVTRAGAVIAVAVDGMGYPVSYNGLVGNAFVNTTVSGNRWLGNYSPESFASLGFDGRNGYFYTDIFNTLMGNPTADLFLDNAPWWGGIGYDAPALSLAAEFQSPVDAKGQTILTMGLTGTIGTALSGNEAAGVGIIYRNDEKAFSFNPPDGGCSVITLISDANPRIVGGLAKSISTGKSGTAIWNVALGAIGLFVTPANGTNAWSGIRTLHKLDWGGGILIMPVFMPPCGGPAIPPKFPIPD